MWRWFGLAVASASLFLWATAWVVAGFAHKAAIADVPAVERLKVWDSNGHSASFVDALGLTLNPLNAGFHFTRGLFLSQEADASVQLDSQETAIRDEVSSSYVRALTLRPHWGVVWAALANHRYHYDDAAAVMAALAKARRFAPHDGYVMLSTIKLGLRLYDSLGVEGKDLVELQIAQFLERDARLLLQSVSNDSVASLLRPHLGPQHQKELDALVTRQRAIH